MAEERPRPAGKKRDRVRLATWSITAAVGLSLLFAGFVYDPPPDTETLVSSASFYLSVGLNDEARGQLQRVLDREPENQHAHLLLGYVDHLEGRYPQALEHYEAGRGGIMAADNPSLRTDYFVTTGLLRLACGDFVGAERDASRLETGNSRQAAGFLIRSFSRLGVGDDTGFRQGLSRAYLLDPFDPIFRIRREFLSEAIPWAAAFCIGG